MTYANAQYINTARTNEIQHHERMMEQLQQKIDQLTKAVTWELAQHQARLKELEEVENSLIQATSLTPLRMLKPTLAPIPSTGRRWIQSRQYAHRSSQKPVIRLVG